MRAFLISLLFVLINANDSLISKAKAGDADALYRYGMIKFNKKEFKKALCCFEQSALKGDDKAQYYVGYLNQNGLGTQQNITDAIYWYQKSVLQNNVLALLNLGLIYVNDSKHKNLNKARAYLYKAQRLGNQKAKEEFEKLPKPAIKKPTNTTTIKKTEKQPQEDTPTKDKIEIIENSIKANKNYKLGVLYYHGRSIRRDIKRAIEYFKEASRYGSQRANFRLGFMYLSGIEVDKSIAKAKYHLELSANGKNKIISDKSKELLEQIKNKEN